MSFERVFELGKKAEHVTFLEMIHLISVLQWVIIAVTIVLGIALLVYGFKEYVDGFAFIGLCLIILPAFITGFLAYNHAQENEMTNWKEHVAMPYILSLPEEKHELVYAKLDPEVIVEAYRYGRSTKTTAMTISFLDESGTIETETDWVEANMTLSEDETAYVTYRKLPESLGFDIKAGNYYKVVHLPKGYQFTELK